MGVGVGVGVVVALPRLRNPAQNTFELVYGSSWAVGVSYDYQTQTFTNWKE